MLKKDREFTIKKNILDNNYQKTLALFQLFVAGLVSGMIAFSIYFHQIQSIDGLVNTIGYGFILTLIATIIFLDELNIIEQKIFFLSK